MDTVTIAAVIITAFITTIFNVAGNILINKKKASLNGLISKPHCPSHASMKEDLDAVEIVIEQEREERIKIKEKIDVHEKRLEKGEIQFANQNKDIIQMRIGIAVLLDRSPGGRPENLKNLDRGDIEGET